MKDQRVAGARDIVAPVASLGPPEDLDAPLILRHEHVFAEEGFACSVQISLRVVLLVDSDNTSRMSVGFTMPPDASLSHMHLTSPQ